VTVDGIYLKGEVHIHAVPAPVSIKEAVAGQLVELFKVRLGVTGSDGHVSQVVLVHLKGQVLALTDLTVQGGGDLQPRNLPSSSHFTGFTGNDFGVLGGVDDPVAAFVDHTLHRGRGRNYEQAGDHSHKGYKCDDSFHVFSPI